MEKYFKYYSLAKSYIGKQVKIINCSVQSYKCYNLINCEGTIQNTRCTTGSPCILTSVAIDVVSKSNPKSLSGYFWLSPDDIKIIEGETIMKKVTNYSKNYEFCLTHGNDDYDKCTEMHAYQGDVNVGDYVICNNGYGNRKLSVRIVDKLVERNSLDTFDVNGEVMGVANVKPYFERKEKEKKASEIKAKMVERAKQYQEEQYWRLIAESDGEMYKLLNEYEELLK